MSATQMVLAMIGLAIVIGGVAVSAMASLPPGLSHLYAFAARCVAPLLRCISPLISWLGRPLDPCCRCWAVPRMRSGRRRVSTLRSSLRSQIEGGTGATSSQWSVGREESTSSPPRRASYKLSKHMDEERRISSERI